MTIHLPEELESSILAKVHSGQFSSLDEAMTQAACLLLRQLEHGDRPAKPVITIPKPNPALGSIGAMRDAAGELDEIVADAMNKRQEPWRVVGGE